MTAYTSVMSEMSKEEKLAVVATVKPGMGTKCHLP